MADFWLFVAVGWAVKHGQKLSSVLHGQVISLAHSVQYRWAAALASTHAMAASAIRFLDKFVGASPFPIKTIQINDGSEFMSEFEAACQKHQIDLWVLPPRSPELNGRVEQMPASRRYEFYTV